MLDFVLSSLVENIYFSLPRLMRQILAHIISTLMLIYLIVWALLEQWNQDLRRLTASIKKHKLNRSLLRRIWKHAKQSLIDFTSELKLLLPFTSRSGAESPSMCVRDYAERYGYGCDDQIVCTQDGYLLLVHHIYARDSQGRRVAPTRPTPVLMMHGLFQSAGVYVTSGKQSFAFWLVDRGYDVWLGNNRGVPCDATTTYLCRNGGEIRAHRIYDRSDDAYWDWSVDDLGRYDFPALVQYVLLRTGKAQVHYVGHSQGNAQAFIGLAHQHNHHLHDKIASFTALAPAASIGSLIERKPLKHIIQMSNPGQRLRYLAVFGLSEFIPLMTLAHHWLPPRLFTYLAFRMFAFLFNWTDKNWDKSRKVHYFRFTPRPTSARAILHWTDIAKRGWLAPFKSCRHVRERQVVYDKLEGATLDAGRVVFRDRSRSPSPNLQSPVSTDSMMKGYLEDTFGLDEEYEFYVADQIPLLVVWGSADYLIDPEKMMHVFDGYALRGRKLNIQLAACVEGYEHLDFLWAQSAEKEVWERMVEVYQRLDGPIEPSSK